MGQLRAFPDPHDRFGRCARGQGAQPSTVEVERQALKIRLVGGRPTQSRGGRETHIAVPGALQRPVQPIFKFQRRARNHRSLGHPERHDVVAEFIGRRNLDEPDTAPAPGSHRLDPSAGAVLVIRLEVLVVKEFAVTLHESEPAGIVVGKRHHAEFLWIGKRAPDPLIGASQDGQSIRVVDFRAEVVGLLAGVFSAPVHAGEGRNP